MCAQTPAEAGLCAHQKPLLVVGPLSVAQYWIREHEDVGCRGAALDRGGRALLAQRTTSVEGAGFVRAEALAVIGEAGTVAIHKIAQGNRSARLKLPSVAP